LWPWPITQGHMLWQWTKNALIHAALAGIEPIPYYLTGSDSTASNNKPWHVMLMSYMLAIYTFSEICANRSPVSSFHPFTIFLLFLGHIPEHLFLIQLRAQKCFNHS